MIARIPIVFTIFSCARVKKLLPPLGGDWLSHAEGVTLACLWHGLPAVAGTARRAGLSAAGKSLSGKSLWKKVAEVDSAVRRRPTCHGGAGGEDGRAMVDKKARSTPRKPVSRRADPAPSLRQALTRCRCRFAGSGGSRTGVQRNECAASSRRSAWGTGGLVAFSSRNQCEFAGHD